MKFSPILVIVLALSSLALPACSMRKKEQRHTARKITTTTPEAKSVTISQQYVCQIHAHRHIKIRALERGHLEAILLKEGQVVKEGDLMFKVVPALNQAAVQEAKAELEFFTVKAPFDGIVGRLTHQPGSLVAEGEELTTLSDNSVMWAYFNVPEKRYLEYMADLNQHKEDLQIELVLANGKKFDHLGKIGEIETDYNDQTGAILFRADFPNPEGLLRHGQTGTVLISRVLKDAIVIPQRATFEFLDKRYVYVVDKEDVAHRREIVIQNELEDDFAIKTGVGEEDKIVLEGMRQVRDGDKVEYEDRPPQ